MSDDGDRDPITTAKDLSSALRATSAELKRLRQYGRRNRLYIVIDVALTVITTAAVSIAIHATGRADVAGLAAAQAHQNITIIHSNQIAACRTGNLVRHRQAFVLDSILSLSRPRPGTPPRKRAAVLAFLHAATALVARGWAPLDCQAIYRLHRGIMPDRSVPSSSP